MLLSSLNDKYLTDRPPTRFGGLSFLALLKTSLKMQCLLFLGLVLCSALSHGAVRMTQPPAVLQWINAASLSAQAQANVEVLRYERIGFYSLDPDTGQNFNVAKGFFANQDSLTGTPSAIANLPDPKDLHGNPLPLDTNLPLIEAKDYQFAATEPIFIVAEAPILPATAFNTRGDGRRYIAVTLQVENGDDHIITLVETAVGSAVYVGYVQANIPTSPIVIPPGSKVSIVYDNYGDVPDSQTTNAPWFVDPDVLAGITQSRQLVVGGFPAPPTEPDYDMFLTKQALRSTAVMGDFLAYELYLENTGDAQLNNVEIIDQLPEGFRYQKKSSKLDGQSAQDPLVSPGGQELTFPVTSLAVGESVSVRYVVEVTVASNTGKAINYARAYSGALRSNQANATVLVEQPFFNDRAFLLGRVMVGSCGEGDAPGLEGVRLYLEDGTNVVTDKHGRWHIEGVMPGTHVLQVDTLTLGPRYRLQKCHDNTRKAGNLSSRFVNVQGGTLWREDWYVTKAWSTDANIEQSLLSSFNEESGLVDVELPVRLGEKQYREVRSQIFIPEEFSIVPGTTALDGEAVEDLRKVEQGVYQLHSKPQGYFARFSLSFSLAVNPDIKDDREIELRAESIGLTTNNETYSVTSTNLLGIKGVLSSDNNIEIHPKFSSMSAELSAQDKVHIEEGVEKLKGQPNLYLHVIGHTDSQGIRYRPGRAINDNYALSKVRAKAVAEYVAQLLDIDMERVTVEGKGPDAPIADNRTAEGRALNRRVSIRFRFTERVSDASLKVLEGYSGINNDKLLAQENGKTAPAKQKQGFVNLSDGMTFPQPVFSATALLSDKLTPKLFINDVEVPAGRIGMKIIEENQQTIRYTWVGLELDRIGDHRVVLKGVDSFGIARFTEEVNLRYSGQIKTITLAEQGDNIADGTSPIKIKLQLLDESDKTISNRAELELLSGSLRPLNASQWGNPLESRNNIVHVDADGYAYFEPVGTAGTYRIRLAASEDVSEQIEISVAPDLREWILVGFAEGTVGYNTLSGNMNALQDEEEHLYSDGDMAFFSRGKVKGEWLLTMAYDNRREQDDSPLLQRIDPQQWYVLYGDDTIRGHDAPSRKKLYVRIEKSDFYALFGDYDTGLSVSELSSYQRTLTGGKFEWKGRNVSATGFAAQTNQGFVRDDIPGDGTSGLYRLSQQGIVFGSEQVEIETRDRFTNEVLSVEPMTRFVDYNLDYIDGSLYFRQPIFVQDENFNPQRIVVRYEVEADDEELVGGGRVEVYDADKKVVVGITGVDDNTLGANASLGGVDATWKPNNSHTVKAEVAKSRQEDISNSRVSSNAGLVEHRYTSEQLDTNVRVEEKDANFGMGQLADDDEDIRISQANARYRFSEQVALSGDVSRQEILSNDNQRDIAETRLEYLQPQWKAYGGLRQAEDTINNELFQSRQVIAGGQRQYMEERLVLSVRGESDIESSDNVDYPNLLSLGSDYRLNNKTSLFANQDFSWSDERRSQDTRIGVRSSPWQGGTVSTDVSRAQDEYGPRLLAHAGLFQTVNLNSQWSTDFGLDRSQTLRDNNTVNEAVFDPRRSLAQGTQSDDYTAASVGAGYRTAEWQWTNRLEARRADTDDKWTVMSGFQHRLDDTDTMAGRFLHFDQDMNSGISNRSSELDFSYSRRPLSNSWYWLNRTRLVADEMEDSLATQEGRRLINNTMVNIIPEYRHQLSLQYGARYVKDTIDDKQWTGYSDLIAAEYRYDITERWDAGFRSSTLASYNSDIRLNSFGVMAGYSPVKDIWVSLGYNFQGFYDSDFSGAETRIKGFVLNFRIKLDQNAATDLMEARRND